jgi:hypothetical protein
MSATPPAPPARAWRNPRQAAWLIYGPKNFRGLTYDGAAPHKRFKVRSLRTRRSHTDEDHKYSMSENFLAP